MNTAPPDGLSFSRQTARAVRTDLFRLSHRARLARGPQGGMFRSEHKKSRIIKLCNLIKLHWGRSYLYSG